MSEIVLSAQILIVDPRPERGSGLASALTEEGFANVVVTVDARQALPLFLECAPDVVVLTADMPRLDGHVVLRQIRARTHTDDLPVLMVVEGGTNAERRAALTAGADDVLVAPFDTIEAIVRVRALAEQRALRLQTARCPHIDRRTPELEAAHLEAMERLARAGEQRDDETGEHTRRVGDLAAATAAGLGLEDGFVALIRQAAPLHDIGKIGIPDSILLKPGPLTAEEFELMMEHTTKGALILADSRVPVLQLAEEIALTHHERWDGTGYAGLRGTSIPLSGRIVAVADVFDALTHDRPYKRAWSVTSAVAEIAAQAGRQFDPDVVAAFLRIRHVHAKPGHTPARVLQLAG